MQPKPGVFNERALRRLDFVIDAAGKAGIRVVCTLTNRVKDFGGAAWYVGSLLGAGQPVDRFWTNVQCRLAFKTWVRVNAGAACMSTWSIGAKNCHSAQRGQWAALPGAMTLPPGGHPSYISPQDDPNLLAWELINEPTTVQDWDRCSSGAGSPFFTTMFAAGHTDARLGSRSTAGCRPWPPM